MKCLGIILDSKQHRSNQTFNHRKVNLALPFLGMYRIVDFPLSNMTNSGIKQVAIIAQHNSRSLSDHLSSNKWWNFGRKKNSLFLLTPYVEEGRAGYFRGTADAMYQNLSFLERSNEKYVVIASGNAIYKCDYRKFVQDHIESNADITIVCSDKHRNLDYSDFGVITLGHNKTVLKFEEKPIDPEGSHISLGIYVLKREYLIEILKCLHEQGRYDFINDFLVRYQKRLSINAYEFNNYWSPINSVQDFYKTNMDFLDSDIRHKLLHTESRIYTKVKDEPPTKYNFKASVVDSIVSNGCIINSYVESSIISRRVFQSENSSIKNSIIMENVNIGNNCTLEYVIADKGAVISEGTQLIGTKEKPVIITKNQIV